MLEPDARLLKILLKYKPEALEAIEESWSADLDDGEVSELQKRVLHRSLGVLKAAREVHAAGPATLALVRKVSSGEQQAQLGPIARTLLKGSAFDARGVEMPATTGTGGSVAGPNTIDTSGDDGTSRVRDSSSANPGHGTAAENLTNHELAAAGMHGTNLPRVSRAVRATDRLESWPQK